MMTWGNAWLLFGETSTDYACGLATIPSDIPPGPLKIKGKTTQPIQSDMPTNTVKLYQARQLHSLYNIHVCLSSATPLQLQHICLLAQCNCTAAVQTCLLVKCYCKIDACCPMLLNQHACRSFATQSCISAGVVLLYLPYLLVWYLPCLPLWCITIDHVNWCCAHYQPCLLVWCIIKGHAFWCGASLSAMPVGVVPHYRACLLVWCFAVDHAF